MIKRIEIENYKSIDKLDFEVGRFNVFIGENGCGKTNILEAIAFASSYRDMENGLLSLKGVRITEPQFFRNGFDQENLLKDIRIVLFGKDDTFIDFSFGNTNEPYPKWHCNTKIKEQNASKSLNINDILEKYEKYRKNTNGDELIDINEWVKNLGLQDGIDNFSAFTFGVEIVNIPILNYLLYAPENYFLRNYNIDTPYTQPLGNKGEGLLKLIKVIKQEKPEQYKEIIEYLHLIDWFSDVEISEDSISGTEFRLADIYLEEGIGGFDIRNANEGFFLLLFYVTLFVSDYTPSFFAIDNIDTALNPKLCTKLIEIFAQLSKKHNKQVLITTHNPSILDGINLNDPEQRLFAVSRNKVGYTRVSRIEKKPPLNGEKSLKLSEQFLRGYIGGIPKNF